MRGYRKTCEDSRTGAEPFRGCGTCEVCKIRADEYGAGLRFWSTERDAITRDSYTRGVADTQFVMRGILAAIAHRDGGVLVITRAEYEAGADRKLEQKQTVDTIEFHLLAAKAAGT